MRYGVLLPHYGQFCSAERIIDGSRRLEAMGFDSVWVRDHLIWQPHGMEGTDRTFLDAFITLAAVAGATSRIELGTAVLIPIRWPLKVAQNFASLSYLSGRRVHAGFGLGSNSAELAAAGFRVEDREQVFAETVQICHQAWSKGTVDWHGELFSVDDVTLAPQPPEEIVTWYGGTTRGSVRRAVAHCDGWLPGRLPLATFDDRLRLLRALGEEAGKQMRVGAIPLVFLDESRAKARAKLDVPALAHSSEGSLRWIKPASGDFSTVEDLEGLLIAGSPDECLAEIAKFRERGVDELIFDLRLQFDQYEEKLELLATAVLPAARKL